MTGSRLVHPLSEMKEIPQDIQNFDHVCCKFEKGKNSGWTDTGCSSVVELKMRSDTNSERKDDFVVDDPVTQEVDCVLESVWHFICLFGLAKNLEELPIAMISAQRNGKPTESELH